MSKSLRLELTDKAKEGLNKVNEKAKAMMSDGIDIDDIKRDIKSHIKSCIGLKRVSKKD